MPSEDTESLVGDHDKRNFAFGVGDNTYQAVGCEEGIVRLVDSFYTAMAAQQEYSAIWKMHSAPPDVSRARLSAFLCGWMGGPRRYHERFGSIQIPRAHASLDIGHEEAKLWLGCMRSALETQEYSEDLVEYLMTQFAVPAERIRQACQR